MRRTPAPMFEWRRSTSSNRHRSKLRRRLQHRQDLVFPDPGQRVRSSPLTRLACLGSRSWIGLDPVGGRGAEAGLRGDSRTVDGTERQAEPHSAVGVVSARHATLPLFRCSSEPNHLRRRSQSPAGSLRHDPFSILIVALFSLLSPRSTPARAGPPTSACPSSVGFLTSRNDESGSRPRVCILSPESDRSASALDHRSRLRTHCGSQKMTVAAMQIAEKKVWAHRS